MKEGRHSGRTALTPPAPLPPFLPLRQQEITRLETVLQEKTRQKEELQQSNAELERKERLMKLQVGGGGGCRKRRCSRGMRSWSER